MCIAGVDYIRLCDSINSVLHRGKAPVGQFNVHIRRIAQVCIVGNCCRPPAWHLVPESVMQILVDT